jgi:probable HAF family extracellular repeat protein
MRYRWIGAVLGMLVLAAAGAASYEVTDVAPYEPPRKGMSRVDNIAINNAGWVVGSVLTGDDYRAFILREGTMELLGTLGGSSSYGAAINERGDVAGHAGRDKCCGHAFLWNGERMKDLGVLKGKYSVGRAVNRSRQVAGYGYNKDSQQRAFLYSDGVMTDLGTFGGLYSDAYGMNDAGQVVGWSNLASGQGRAFRYDAGVMQNLGALHDDGFSSARAINDAGDAVGSASPGATGPFHAVLFSAGQVTDLGTLGGAYSEALAINAKGDIVGWSTTRGTDYEVIARRAFLYRDGRMISLSQRLDPLTGAGWKLNVATGINGKGQIVGWGRHDGNFRIFLLTPMREEASTGR